MSFIPGRFTATAALAAAFTLSAVSATVGAQDAVVRLSLTHNTTIVHVKAGDMVGSAPQILRVHVGDRVVFANDDPKADHTATGLPGSAFVDDPHWSDASLKAYGQIGDDAWSSGDLAPGKRSPPLPVSKAGTYLYGCFFHYSAGMRGEIIVEP